MQANVITTKGKEFLNKTLAVDGCDLKLHSVVIGDGTVATVEEARSLTAVKSPKKTLEISSLNYSVNVIDFQVVLDNINLEEGFSVKEFGINVIDETTQEVILFWYINKDDTASFLKPASAGQIRTTFTMNMDILAQTNVTITTEDPTNSYVTPEQAQAMIDEKINHHIHFKKDIVDLNTAKWMKKVCLYYGYPTAINDTWSVNAAVEVYGQFDVVVFGDEYNETSHEENANLKEIIRQLREKHPNTEIFGYVPCAVDNGTKNYTTEVVKQKIDLYFACGDIDGIFCDEWGYDYKNTRERQNEIISYIRSKKVDKDGNPIGRAFVNSWEDTYVFSNEDIVIDWMQNFRGNPNKLPSMVNETDYSLYENMFWQINRTTQQHQEAWPIFKAWVYYNEVQAEFGKTFHDKYKTKTVALDAIKKTIYTATDQTQAKEMMTISLAMSRILNVDCIALGADDWSSSNCYMKTYDLPIIDGFDRGDAPNAVTYKLSGGNSGFPNYYQCKLGNDTWEAKWTDNSTSMSKGVREVYKNGVKIVDLWETDEDRFKKSVITRDGVEQVVNSVLNFTNGIKIGNYVVNVVDGNLTVTPVTAS